MTLPVVSPASRATPGRWRPRSAGWLTRLLAAVAAQSQRRGLAYLDDAILRDIGLTRDEALREATRGFWDWDPVRRG